MFRDNIASKSTIINTRIKGIKTDQNQNFLRKSIDIETLILRYNIKYLLHNIISIFNNIINYIIYYILIILPI